MKSFSIPINRRDFMKLAGLTTAGLLLGGSADSPQVEAAEKPSGKTVKYAGKDIPLLYDVDICVCGGGPSGTAAAISAARKGAKVVLLERSVALGGLGVIGCVYPFMQTHAPNSDTPYLTEVKKRLLEKGIDYDDKVTGQTWHNPEVLSLIYDEMCEESRVNILYETVLL